MLAQRCSSSKRKGAAEAFKYQRKHSSPYGDAQDGEQSLGAAMPRWWPDLAGSWIFYSTLPPLPGVSPRFERIARFAPLLGLVIGGAQAMLWWLGQQLGLPIAACTALVLAFGLILSGGLHLDGVMDTGDGLAAGPRQLEAMADSRIGASGLLAVVLVLLLKTAALLSLGPLAPAMLIWSAVWGRIAPLPAMAWFPYLRNEGSAAFHRLQRQELAMELLPGALLIGLLAALCLSSNPTGLRIIALVAGLSGFLPSVLVPLELGRRLGGHTGDSYGACVEWSEALALWCGWFSWWLLN